HGPSAIRPTRTTADQTHAEPRYSCRFPRDRRSGRSASSHHPSAARPQTAQSPSPPAAHRTSQPPAAHETNRAQGSSLQRQNSASVSLSTHSCVNRLLILLVVTLHDNLIAFPDFDLWSILRRRDQRFHLTRQRQTVQ